MSVGWTRTVLTTAVLLAGGCGPIQSTQVLVDADAELAAAQRANARQEAAYEYELAQAYLRKAKETNGRAEYQTSVRYARRALACAEAAVRIAQNRPPPAEAEPCDPAYAFEAEKAETTATSTAPTSTSTVTRSAPTREGAR